MTENKMLIIAQRNRISPVVMAMPDKCLCQQAAQRVSDFFERYTGIKPVKSAENKLPSDSPVIVVGTVEGIGNLAERVDGVGKLDARPDAFLLEASLRDGRPFIFAVGRGEQGASAAAWALLRELRVRGETIVAPPLKTVDNPFIALREVVLGTPWGTPWLNGPPEVKKKYSFDAWPMERSHRYIDLLDAYGFNSIQISDVGQWYAASGWVNTAEEWRTKLVSAMDKAHRNGQRVTLFIWGITVTDHKLRNSLGLCPNNPDHRLALEEHWSNQLQYASHIDHFITHWGDPGGCKCEKCSIATAQQIHAQLHERFRAGNPKIQSTFRYRNLKVHFSNSKE